MSIDYGYLIQNLGPVNNRFREYEGVHKIVALWEMGDILIQGTGDGSLDHVLWEINKRSFITRDVLRYASIVRHEWKSRQEVERLFSNVKKYSLFREALPFLKGNRQGIDEATYREVIARIGSGQVSEVKVYLQGLKERYIGRSNKKGVSLTKVAVTSDGIVRFMTELLKKVMSPAFSVNQIHVNAGDESLRLMSLTFYGLVADQPLPVLSEELEGHNWREFAVMLNSLTSASREEKSALRKLIGVQTLMEWTDLFNALRTDQDFTEWRVRSNYKMKVR